MNKRLLQGYMVGLVMLTVGAFLFTYFSIRETILQDEEHLLRAFAQEFSEHTMAWGSGATPEEWAGFAELGAEKFNGQITIYDANWQFVADSHQQPESMYEPWLDTEVADAKLGSFHRVVRWSEIFSTDTLYLITRISISEQAPMGLRVAYPLYALDAFRRRMILIGLMLTLLEGLFFALVEAYLMARYEKNFQEVNRILTEIAQGRVPDLSPVENNRELHKILVESQRVNQGLMEMVEKTNRRNSQINSVLLGIDSGLLVVNPEGKVVLVNPQAEALLEINRGILSGRGTESAICQLVLDGLQEVFRTGQSKTIVDTSGKGLELEIFMTGIASKYEPFDQIGALAVIRDLTRIKKLERMRVEFVSNVSHELRTPLTIISGFVEMLQDWKGLEDEDRDKAFRMIEVETERLKRLVSELLKLSKIEHRVNEAEYQLFSVPDTMRAVAAAMAPSCQQKDIRLSLKLPEESKGVFLREEWVRQILVNLIENAIKYSSAGTAIEMGATEDDQQLTLWVRDEGIGISSEDQKRIFERFFRVDKARSSRVKGSGLGLSIVKYMVKAMEGTILVESELGQGSCFTVKFPLSRKFMG